MIDILSVSRASERTFTLVRNIENFISFACKIVIHLIQNTLGFFSFQLN